MAKNRKYSATAAFIGLTVFSVWLISVAPQPVTVILVVSLYVAFAAYGRRSRHKPSTPSAVRAHKAPATSDKSRAAAHPSSTGPKTNVRSSRMDGDDEFASFVPRKEKAAESHFAIDYSGSGFAKKDTAHGPEPYWVPPTRTVQVRSYIISGGFIYVGAGLLSAANRGEEPSLVNPALKVGRDDDYTRRQLDYFPSYAHASADGRAAYLNWLVKGRRDESADLGYVYLYYYGLERRAFIDAQEDPAARAEVPAICEEVRALIAVYGKHAGFAMRARSFLQFFHAQSLVSKKLYLESPEAYPLRADDGFAHRLALSQAVADGRQLPMDWWTSWLQYSLPRTKAFVGPRFKELYQAELAEAFPNGLTDRFRPESAGKLVVRHSLVYPGLEHTPAVASFDIPDFTSDKGRASALLDAYGRKIAEKLEPYTRLVSRSPQKADSAEGLLLLPPSLWPAEVRATLESKAALLRGANAVLEAELLATLLAPIPLPEKLDRALYLTLIERLHEAFGLSVEPDPRFGGALPGRDSRIVLFTLRGRSAPKPSDAYLKKAAEVWFYSTPSRVAASRDAGQVARAESFLARLKGGDAEQTRLQALFRFYLTQPLSTTGMKKRLELLTTADATRIATNLVALSQPESGLPGVEALRWLEKLFLALEQDPQSLYSMAHAGVTPDKDSRGHSSKGRDARADSSTAASLDLRKIENLRAETVEVGAVLGEIFEERTLPDIKPEVDPDSGLPASELPVRAEPVQAEDTGAGAGGSVGSVLPGLDDAHSSLVRELLTRQGWTRGEAEQLSHARGLMLDAALERINDAAFDVAGDALFDGTDDIVVNDYVAQEMGGRQRE